MRRFFYDSFQEYARECGIKKINFILKTNDALSKRTLEERVLNQLELISEFHRISCGFNGYLKRRINNDTCKLVEDYKVQIKRLSKYIERIRTESMDSIMDNFLLEEGGIQVERAQESIDFLEQHNYIDLVARSMKRVEICLTDVDFDNLVKGEDLEIVNFEDVAYNMVEMDAYYLLGKLKRKGMNIDYKKSIERFCELEGLQEDSCDFILALLSYPHEFMKIYEKYRRNKKSWTEEEYVKRMKAAINEDGISLIGEVKRC
jgi:hypothetical protein